MKTTWLWSALGVQQYTIKHYINSSFIHSLKKQPEIINIHKLQNKEVQDQFRHTINERLDTINLTSLNVEQTWHIFKAALRTPWRKPVALGRQEQDTERQQLGGMRKSKQLSRKRRDCTKSGLSWRRSKTMLNTESQEGTASVWWKSRRKSHGPSTVRNLVKHARPH